MAKKNLDYTHELSISASKAENYYHLRKAMENPCSGFSLINANNGRLVFRLTDLTKQIVEKELLDLESQFYDFISIKNV